VSGAPFHVHGPQDRAVGHGAQSGDGCAARIEVTAVLSTVGPPFAYQAGATQNDALLPKNGTAIRRTVASSGAPTRPGAASRT
jgi:hypothetical protein